MGSHGSHPNPTKAAARGGTVQAETSYAIVFRRFAAGENPPPEAGELHIRLRRDGLQTGRHGKADHERLDMANLLLEEGLEAFPQGPGRIERIVVNDDPTLDDMLAATLASRLVCGEKLPDGVKEFATYAGIVRQGMRPSADIPVEASLEGIFLAIRAHRGNVLTDPAEASQFLDDWSRMATGIFQSAEAGADPFTCPVFASGPQFAVERAYLAKDHEVYRQDVQRGEQWIMRMPGHPADASALLLRQPKSRLFRHWSRSDKEAPAGGCYLFLAVDWGEGHWVFSTDPAQRLLINRLAELLQAAEAAKSASAEKDPWYDGRRHDHTLVAAPRAGTRLSERQVIRLVKRWTRARRSFGMTLAGAGLAACLLLAGIFLVLPNAKEHRGIEQLRVSEDERSLPAGPRTGKDYALLMATDEYDHWPRLRNPILDATTVAEELSETYNFETELLANPTQQEVLRAIERYSRKQYGADDQLFVFCAGHGDFNPDTKEGFIVAKDSRLRAEDSGRTSYLAHSRLRDLMEKIPCNHIFVVLDVCFGGTVDFGVATGGFRGEGGVYEEISKSQFIARKLQHKTRLYITSGGQELVPDGRPGEHSPFAEKLIESVRSGGGDDGVLTYGEIWQCVDKGKLEPRKGEFRGNEPNSDFLFIRKN